MKEDTKSMIIWFLGIIILVVALVYFYSLSFIPK